MAHFYGKLTGKGKELTKTGLKKEGMSATLQTLQSKLRIDLQHSNGYNDDTYAIFYSNSDKRELLLTIKNDGTILFVGNDIMKAIHGKYSVE